MTLIVMFTSVLRKRFVEKKDANQVGKNNALQ